MGKIIRQIIMAMLFMAFCFAIPLKTAIATPNSQIQRWSQANVVYLGEHHDSPEDHVAELAILEQLYKESPKLEIGMEMFQRPFQGSLDDYLAGKIDAIALQEQTEYANRWGFDWNYYAPILEFAKAHQLEVKALNTPLEITYKVGQSGLDSLDSEDFQWIPAKSQLDLSNDAYRDRIKTLYESFHHGKGNSDNFEHFYQAQILWDETMADAIATEVTQHPQTTFVSLVGAGHIIYGDGIPNRVQKRVSQNHFQQYSVQINPDSEHQDGTEESWFNDPSSDA